MLSWIQIAFVMLLSGVLLAVLGFIVNKAQFFQAPNPSGQILYNKMMFVVLIMFVWISVIIFVDLYKTYYELMSDISYNRKHGKAN
jgi:hypothetical protein